MAAVDGRDLDPISRGLSLRNGITTYTMGSGCQIGGLGATNYYEFRTGRKLIPGTSV